MRNYPKLYSINQALDVLNKKGVICYPVEAMFAIGCDPDSKIAVNNLLKLKNRSVKKGLILIAASFKQLELYVSNSTLSSSQLDYVFSFWPGHTTFIFPAKSSTPRWLTGNFNSLAVRVTDHPLVIKLCNAFGKPLVSTSANSTGFSPCCTIQEVHNQFGNNLPIVSGEIGNYLKSSKIKDVLTGKRLR